MSSLQFIKKINSVENINFSQIIMDLVFGTRMPRPYNEKTVYMIDDMALVFNVDKQKYDVYICAEDNTTGVFDVRRWKPVSVYEMIKNSDTSKIIMLSKNQPLDRNNSMWAQPIKVRDGGINVSGADVVIITKGSEFVASKDIPNTDGEVKLWFDCKI